MNKKGIPFYLTAALFSGVAMANYTAIISEVDYVIEKTVIEYDDWSEMNPTSGYYDCDTYESTKLGLTLPEYTYITDTATKFTFSENCSQDFERTRNVYYVHSDGSKTLKTTEKESETKDVSKITVQDASKNEVFAYNGLSTEGVYIKEDYDPFTGSGIYTFRVYVDGVSKAKEDSSNRNTAINSIRSHGYEIGTKIYESDSGRTLRYAFTMTGSPVATWEYTTSTSVLDCSGHTQADYWDYTGNTCSPEGSTMQVCGDVGGGMGNNPAWTLTTLTCVK